MHDHTTSDSKHLFRENLLERMKEPNEPFRISSSPVNNSATKFKKRNYCSGSKHSFGNTNTGAWPSTFYSLNFEDPKNNHQQEVEQVLRKCAKNTSGIPSTM